MPSPAVAIAGVATAGVVGAVSAAKSQASAARSAAEAQKESAQQATDVQKYIFETQRSDLLPFLEAAKSILPQYQELAQIGLEQAKELASVDITPYLADIKRQQADLAAQQLGAAGQWLGLTPEQVELARQQLGAAGQWLGLTPEQVELARQQIETEKGWLEMAEPERKLYGKELAEHEKWLDEVSPALRELAKGAIVADKRILGLVEPKVEQIKRGLGLLDYLEGLAKIPLGQNPYYQFRLSELKKNLAEDLEARGLRSSAAFDAQLGTLVNALTAEETEKQYGRLSDLAKTRLAINPQVALSSFSYTAPFLLNSPNRMVTAQSKAGSAVGGGMPSFGNLTPATGSVKLPEMPDASVAAGLIGTGLQSGAQLGASAASYGANVSNIYQNLGAAQAQSQLAQGLAGAQLAQGLGNLPMQGLMLYGMGKTFKWW